ncbi:uncharacterized protein BXZ73DRAFT_91146 [Epithele typhae]|uniref:uncharacterized protein n=1 Tax=Epithele typhae TaxID=378194 RepID=UPI0020076ECA|nr:uncharacterized protein BXZ73DRAFT_91146 [Epithele typhae]KAH9924954.1 hypothetical protein BXZ73DRAFT_91146 [Epithele typhae]
MDNDNTAEEGTNEGPVRFEGDVLGDQNHYSDYDWDDFDEYNPEADTMNVDDDLPSQGASDTGQRSPQDWDLEDNLLESLDGMPDLEDDFSDDEDAENFDAERHWEPPLPENLHRPSPSLAEEVDEDQSQANADRQRRLNTQDALRPKTYVVPYPENSPAGCPLRQQQEQSGYEATRDSLGSPNNPYAPFCSSLDFSVAMWAKMRGPGSTALTELLAIENLVKLLGLSFKNSRELNQIIDEKLTSLRPRFIRREILVTDEVFEFFYRDVLECIRALFGDPEFSGVLVFRPERHYADADHTLRVFFDMHTGKWWWSTQEAVERLAPGGTIIPIIVSSDKTQLTVFGNKTAYPVYLTIGNLPKHIRRKPSRRGQILLAYLPSTRLENITCKAARRRTHSNLFHAFMTHIFRPLRRAGLEGINLASGDGVMWRGHPILAIHAGDYPEQLLASCCKSGDCPRCDIDREDVGATTDPNRPFRDVTKVVEALSVAETGTKAEFVKACAAARIKPVAEPYWLHLPFVNIFRSITPDILHQLHQGVIKHVVAWVKLAYGTSEIDARCRRLPPNHQIRIFMKGISSLQRVTGKEHAAMCRILLGLVAGLPLRDGFSPIRLVQAYPAHTSASLKLLKDTLRRFHLNKDIFVLFGTTDNYDTQYTERLHIDLAKDAYRATNRKDEYLQMTLWLERKEKMHRHAAFVAWRLNNIVERSLHSSLSSNTPLRNPAPPHSLPPIHPPKWPSAYSVTFSSAAQEYGAEYLREALARFVIQFNNPTLSTAEVEQRSWNVYLPFNKVSAYHKLKFVLSDAQAMGIMEGLHDAAHARPRYTDKRGNVVPSRFDTVLVNETGAGRRIGVHGYRVGRLRMVFTLPQNANKSLFPGVMPPRHLTYIEWFTAFTNTDATHGMYRVTRCRGPNGDRLASVVEMSTIRRSCHLLPVFPSPENSRAWTSSTVLDSCDTFFVNPFSDMHMYMTLI